MGSKGLPCCPFLLFVLRKAGGVWKNAGREKRNMFAFVQTADIIAGY